jgi:FtsH-binding integral membrane protein
MSYSENPYQSPGAFGTIAARAEPSERADFIRKTYLHLAGAVLAFIGLEALLLNSPLAAALPDLMLSTRYSWLIVMIAFVGVSYLAQTWASSSTSVGMQYAGLGLYVVAEAVIFMPILMVATRIEPNPIPAAGLVTAVLFGGLTVIVFATGADFSFLRGALMLSGLIALLLVAWAVFANHTLGIPFTIAMIGLCCGYILYDTSNVMYHYRIGQHVAASLALFASVAMLFYYILRLIMQMNRR